MLSCSAIAHLELPDIPGESRYTVDADLVRAPLLHFNGAVHDQCGHHRTHRGGVVRDRTLRIPHDKAAIYNYLMICLHGSVV